MKQRRRSELKKLVDLLKQREAMGAVTNPVWIRQQLETLIDL